MNWIERMYELKGKDLYSQNGEGLYLEYVFNSIQQTNGQYADIGSGDGFILSNTRHLSNLGWGGYLLDELTGDRVTAENVTYLLPLIFKNGSVVGPDLVSIDTDGNDYWIIDAIFSSNEKRPRVVIAEFNASYTDSRTIKYNPDHVWAGDSYYGFTFEAGVKLAEKHGYKVIFQIANMNMIMVREDLIKGLYIPPVTYEQSTYFKMSERTDWEYV